MGEVNVGINGITTEFPSAPKADLLQWHIDGVRRRRTTPAQGVVHVARTRPLEWDTVAGDLKQLSHEACGGSTLLRELPKVWRRGSATIHVGLGPETRVMLDKGV